jgi:RNA polymerase sigma factor (sigma-70 family)
MRRLDYMGVIDQRKMDLIIERAKRMGFRGCDIDDVLQEVVPAILLFRFDAARSNGATESTALVSVIDNHLKEMVRAECRYRARLKRVGARTETSYDPFSDENRIIDVQDVMETLSPRERDVCNMLALGCSIHEIAKMRGCGWHTVERLIRDIRERFEEAGLCEEGCDLWANQA